MTEAAVVQQQAAPSAPQSAPADSKPAGARSSLGTMATQILNRPRATSPLGIPPRQGAPVVTPTVSTAPVVATATTAVAKPADPKVAPPDRTVLGKGGAPIPTEAVADRVARERNRFLRQEYGTTDPTEIERIRNLRKSQLEEYAKLKADREETDRQAMSEAERMRSDLETSQKTVDELKARILDMETGQAVSRQTDELKGVASKYVDATMLEDALWHFQRYINKLDPKEVKRVTQRSIDRWFVKFVEERPRFRIETGSAGDSSLGTAAIGVRGVDAPGPSSAAIVAPKPSIRRVPIATSAAPRGGVPKAAAAKPLPGTVAGKTVRPGKGNSMTRQELNAHLRSKGIKPW
jgi:hypothetical protein